MPSLFVQNKSWYGWIFLRSVDVRYHVMFSHLVLQLFLPFSIWVGLISPMTDDVAAKKSWIS